MLGLKFIAWVASSSRDLLWGHGIGGLASFSIVVLDRLAEAATHENVSP